MARLPGVGCRPRKRHSQRHSANGPPAIAHGADGGGPPVPRRHVRGRGTPVTGGETVGQRPARSRPIDARTTSSVMGDRPGSEGSGGTLSDISRIPAPASAVLYMNRYSPASRSVGCGFPSRRGANATKFDRNRRFG